MFIERLKIMMLLGVVLLTGCVNTADVNDSSTGKTDIKVADSSSIEDKEKIVRFGSIGSPTGKFNPLYSGDDYTNYVTNLIFETLVGIDAEGNIKPNLATSWEISEDSKTVTLHLAENISWTDGKPFTANDIKFTLEFMSNKNYKGYNSVAVQQIEGYEKLHSGEATELSGIEIKDDYTLAITTTKVYASFFEKIGRGIGIIPKHIWETVDVATADENTELLQKPIGTGPFILSEYAPDKYIILTKNNKYFKGEPKLDKIVIQVVNPDTAQAQILNGELDILRVESINPEDIKEYEQKRFEIQHNLLNAFQHMVINQNDKVLSNKDVRQALTYAINREGIVQNLIYGYGNVAHTVYTPKFWAYPEASELNPYEYNPKKALEILTQKVGFEFRDGILYNGNEPISFTLIYPSGNKAREAAAAVIQQNFKEIGIEVKLELMEFATMVSILEERKPDNFQLALLGNGFGADADISTNVGTGGTGNHSQYSNQEVDKLLGEALLSLDNESRAPIYKQIAKILNDELPVVYLYNWERFTIINPNVKNVAVTTYSFYDGVENWDIK